MPDINNEYKQVISYSTIIDDFKKFKKNPTTTDILDNPGTFYFKIMFYFNNPGDVGAEEFTSNLLGLGENTAYAYLKDNGEEERARYMHDFICMLSNISSECPWYFKTIEGLDTAVEHTYLKEFKFEEIKSINIKCLNDSVDTRISTLLELYRSACYSHRWKKEIVPANLRKFDMGVYIFQAPISGIHYTNTNKDIVGWRERIVKDSEFANCKYLEFHNCEIDPNSIKTCYATVDNEKGFPLEPTITINYDDCFISSYNEELVSFIGDFVKLDISNISTAEGDDKTIRSGSSIDKLLERISEDQNSHLKLRSIKQQTNIDIQAIANTVVQNANDKASSKAKSIANKVIQNINGKASTKVESVVKKAVLGNVYGLSISNALNVINQANSGDIIGAGISAIKQGKNTYNTIKKGTVISDTIPSLVGKNDLKLPTGQALGNVVKNIVRNL